MSRLRFSAPLLTLVVCWGAISAEPAVSQVQDLRDIDLPEWRLEEELRLGSLDGPHDAFVFPTGIQVDADGRIYILDTGIPALRIFDVEGRFVRQIGSRGEGPGEYLAPAAFGVAGDTVWVSDARTGRLTLYDVGGGLIRSSRLVAAENPAELAVPVKLLLGGDMLAVTPPGPPPEALRSSGPVRFEQSLVQVDAAEGQIRDTIVIYAAEYPAVALREGRRLTAAPVVRQAPVVNYDPESGLIREVHRRAPAPDTPAEFRILERTRAGHVVRERTFLDSPREMSSQVLDSLFSDVRERLADAPPSLIEEVLLHLDFPEQQPSVTGIAAGEDGTLWIQREPFPDGGIRFLVLGQQLEPVATLTLPPGSERRVGPIDSSSLWTLERDEWDVPRLTRYRILR